MISAKIKAIAARSALGLAAALCLLAGIALLSIAGGLVLAQAFSLELALTVLGVAYLGIGLLLIALCSTKTPSQPPPHQAQDLTEAFFRGLGAGTAARRGFDAGRGRSTECGSR